MSFLTHENVISFQVSVQELLGVEIPEAFDDLEQNTCDEHLVLEPVFALGPDEFAELSCAHQRHDNPQLLIHRERGVVRQHIRMLALSDRVNLVLDISQGMVLVENV